MNIKKKNQNIVGSETLAAVETKTATAPTAAKKVPVRAKKAVPKPAAASGFVSQRVWPD